MKNLSQKISAEAMALATVLTSEVGADEFNDGGSTNWVRNAMIGLGIGAILFGLAKVFVPEIVDGWIAKVKSFF